MTDPFWGKMVTSGGGQTSPGSSNLLAPPTIPSGRKDIPSYEDDDYVGVMPYVGQLGRLFARSMNPFNWERLTAEENQIMKDRFMSGVRSAGQFMINMTGSPTAMAEEAAKMGAAAGRAIEGMKGLVGDDAPLSERGGRLLVGALKTFVEPLLTATSGEAIVGGQIVPATPEEMAQGGLTALGTLAGAGTYGAASRALGTAAGGTRAGRIARNIAREYVAEASAGITADAVSNPDRNIVESVINNAVNPLAMVTAVPAGVARTVIGNRRAATLWDDERANQPITAIPSAKQLAVTSETPMVDVLARLDAITSEDNWWRAGIKKVEEGSNEVFRFVGVDADDARGIWNQIRGNDIEFVRPSTLQVKDKLPAALVQPVKGKDVHFYFDDPFDMLVANSSDLELEDIARRYTLPEDRLFQHRKNIKEVLKNAEILDASGFRYTNIPRVDLPVAKSRINAYMSKTGDIMVTSRRLTPEQFKVYENTGYLPNERVNTPLGLALIDGVGAKNGALVRLQNGQYHNFNIDEIWKVADGHIPVWSKLSYNESLVDDFLSFLDRNNRSKSFDSVMKRYAEQKGWTAEDLSAFEQYVYRRISDKDYIFGQEQARIMGPVEERWVRAAENMNRMLGAQADYLRTSLTHKLNQMNYKVEATAAGKFRVVDREGNVKVADFNTLDEVMAFADSDFRGGETVRRIGGDSPLPYDVLPLVNPKAGPRAKEAKASLLRWKASPFVSKYLRRADRMVMDVAEIAGLPELGTRIAYNMNRMSNAVNAFEQGRAAKLLKLGEEMQNLVNQYNISPSRRSEVTLALEKMSIDETRAMLTQTENIAVEVLFADATRAFKDTPFKDKPVDRLIHLFNRVRDGRVNVDELDVPTKEALTLLNNYINDGIFSSDSPLRHLRNLQEGDNLTASQFIETLGWGQGERRLYDTAKKFYKEGANVFGISDQITGYAPWIQKWEGAINMYAKRTPAETEFIHELFRLGTTDDATRITDILDLTYRYAKAGIHHKAPVAGGKGLTSGELLTQINRDVSELAQMRVNEQPIDVRNIQEWIANFRGIPEAGAGNVAAVDAMIRQGWNKDLARGGMGEALLDATALVKLGIRPLLAARDGTSSLAIASLYDLENNILNISPSRLRRINEIIGEGFLPQTDINAMLARNSRTAVSKAADIGMKASLQPQAYKVILGNAYIDTFDKSIAGFKYAKGDYNKLVEYMGATLDGNNRPVQKYFIELAQTDPIEAARFLASSNAYNIANNFGRLNNPLGWQTSFGRFLGQFGSWGLNATTVMLEAIANSRNSRSAAKKLAKLGVINGLIYGAGSMAGVGIATWLVTPLNTLPGFGGPTFDAVNDLIDAGQQLFSNDEYQRERAIRTLRGMSIEPTFFKDLREGAEIWQNEGNGFKALMEASGFRMLPE